MKTLELTDEQYDMLIEFKNELLTQNNRSTRDPIFCIMDIKEIPTDSDYSDTYYWIDRDGDSGNIADNEADLFEYLIDYEEYTTKILEEYNNNEGDEFEIISEGNKELIKSWFIKYIEYSSSLDLDFDIPTIEKVYILKEQFIVENAPHSLFEKDAVDHLKSNHYHYTDKAKTYACCNWRAPRMEKLREFLINFNVGEK